MEAEDKLITEKCFIYICGVGFYFEMDDATVTALSI